MAGKKLTNLAIDTASAGDTIDKLSQKLGLSAEAYQEWDYVLSQSGVNIESAGMGFKTLTNQIDSAKKGSKEAQERFAKLGISMDDINKLSREELFTKAITGMQGLADNTDRAALANQLFGRSGQELAPLFNATAESTEALKQKAHDLGFVMSDEAVSAAVKYTDSLDTLKRTFQGVKNNIVSQLLPGFTSITTGLSELLAGQDGAKEKLQQGAKEIVDSLKKIAPRIVDVLLTVVGAAAEIAPTIITSLVQGISSNLGKIISAAGNIVKTLILSLVRALSKIGKSVLSIFPSLLYGLKQVFFNIVKALPSLLKIVTKSLPTLIPQAVSGIVDMAVYLMKHIGEILQPVIDNLPDIIKSLVSSLLDNLPILIDGLISLCIQLAQALPQAALAILDVLPDVISMIIDTLLGDCLPQLIEGLIQVVMEVVSHTPEIIAGLIQAIPKVVSSIVEGLFSAAPKIWGAITSIFSKAWDFIKDVFSNSGVGEFFFNIFDGAFEGIKNAWSGVKEFFSGILSGIREVFSGLDQWFKKVFGKVVDGIKGAWEGIQTWFQDLWEGIWRVIKTPINWIIGGINTIIDGLNMISIDVPDWVPIVGGQHWGFDLGHVPELARGGVVKGGTPFIAGEAGAEAVIPLENNNQWIYKFAHVFADGLSAFYDGDNFTQTPTKGAGGKIVNINLYLDNVNVKNDDDIEVVANKVSERIAEKLIAEGMAVG